MNNRISNEQLNELIRSAVNSCGPLPHDEKFSLLISALRELLALREAGKEPVAYIFKHPAGKLFWALTDESNKGQSDVIPVYAAPQLPAVPGPLTIDDATAKLSVEYSLSNTGVTGFRDGWNACVAEIAAAPKPEVK